MEMENFMMELEKDIANCSKPLLVMDLEVHLLPCLVELEEEFILKLLMLVQI